MRLPAVRIGTWGNTDGMEGQDLSVFPLVATRSATRSKRVSGPHTTRESSGDSRYIITLPHQRWALHRGCRNFLRQIDIIRCSTAVNYPRLVANYSVCVKISG